MSQLGNRAAADEAAALWMFRHDCGLNRQDEADFAAWRAASSDNVDAWARLVSTWESVGTVDLPLIDAMRTDALTARPTAHFPFRRAIAAAMAVAAMVVGVVGWKVMPLTPSSARSVEIAASEAPSFVSGNVMRTVMLADGSRAILERDSALIVRFSSSVRSLRVQKGEIFFDVRHDGRPFAVQAGTVTVTATGTRFDVKLSLDRVSAKLERGAVIVTRKGDQQGIALVPGQMMTAINGRPMSVSKVASTTMLSRTAEFLEFRDTPLEDAVAQVNRAATVRIRVVGAAARLKVSGRFRADDPSGFLAAITQLLPVRQRHGIDGAIELLAK